MKWIAGVAVVLVLVIASLVVQIPLGSSAEEIRNNIEQSVPLGSSRQQVSDFARKAGMEQSPYLEKERMINAIKRGVSKGLFSETSVYVRFYFDEKGGLQRYTVEKVSTSL